MRVFFYKVKYFIFCLFFLFYSNAYAVNIYSDYNNKFYRLSEILGSLHYLQNLCYKKNMIWRISMIELIHDTKFDTKTKSQFYAAFNNAYRSFSLNYHQCTASSKWAHENYRLEAKKLIDELLHDYGTQPS